MTRELEETKITDTMTNQAAKDWQIKSKIFEQNIQNLTEEKDLIERQLRQTQVERDGFHQKIANLNEE